MINWYQYLVRYPQLTFKISIVICCNNYMHKYLEVVSFIQSYNCFRRLSTRLNSSATWYTTHWGDYLRLIIMFPSCHVRWYKFWGPVAFEDILGSTCAMKLIDSLKVVYCHGRFHQQFLRVKKNNILLCKLYYKILMQIIISMDFCKWSPAPSKISGSYRKLLVDIAATLWS